MNKEVILKPSDWLRNITGMPFNRKDRNRRVVGKDNPFP